MKFIHTPHIHCVQPFDIKYVDSYKDERLQNNNLAPLAVSLLRPIYKLTKKACQRCGSYVGTESMAYDCNCTATPMAHEISPSSRAAIAIKQV